MWQISTYPSLKYHSFDQISFKINVKDCGLPIIDASNPITASNGLVPITNSNPLEYDLIIDGDIGTTDFTLNYLTDKAGSP